LKIHPLNLLADAFSANIDSAEYAELWAKITVASKNGSDPSPLSNIFADETIRFLSLVSDGGNGKEKEAKSPTFSILPLSPPTSPVKRSFSTGDEPSTSRAAVEHVHHKFATDPVSATPISPLPIGSDWAQFSSSGFLDSSPAIVPLVSTLFDTDIEKTVPRDPPVQTLSRKSSKRAKRKSVDVPRAVAIADSFATEVSSAGVAASIEGEESGPVVKATKLEIIQFDEAFIDFWSDSLLDPITSKWPTFIICKFKSTLVPRLTYGKAEEGKPQKTLKWLILEQVYTVKPAPPPAPVVAPPIVDPEPTEVPSSPTASTSGKKRFMFWSVSRSGSTSSATSTGDKEKSKKKTPKISEMGELIEEDGGKPPSSSTKNRKSVDQKRKSVDQAKKSVDQKPMVEQAVVEGSTTTTNAVVAAAAIVATGATVLAAVPEAEDRPVEDERVEGQKAVLVADADVKVSALGMITASHSESPIEPVPTEVAAISEPISNEEIVKLEPVSSPVVSKVEVIAPVIEEEKVVEAKEVGIVPAAIEEVKVGDAEATKEEAVEKAVEAELVKEVGIIPATIEEEKIGESQAMKEEAEEKVVEAEAVKEVEIVPAAIEEEKVVEAKAMKEEVEIIPAAIEKAIDAELPKEELAVVETIVLPSIPVVETLRPVEPEVAKDEVAAVKLVVPAIVEVEEIHAVEGVAPVVEAEPSQEEVTITEPIVQPSALEVEASPAAEGLLVDHPAPEETKAEDAETSAVVEPVSIIENAVIPVSAAEEVIETEATEPLLVVQPTEPEALEPAKSEDEILIDNEDTQIDTEAVPSVEEVVVPVSIPADSASEDVVIVEREESAPPVSEPPVASGVVEEEVIPALQHLQEVSAVPLADVDLKEKDVSAISANMEVDVEEEKEDISVEGFSVVPIPEPITSNEEWEEVLAVSESDHAIQVVQQQVEEVPVVPVLEITASDEEDVLVPESEPAVQVAEEKAEENVEVVEAEIVPGQPTDVLAEAKEEDEAEQMKVEVVEQDVEEVMAKEVEDQEVEVEKADEVDKVDMVEEAEVDKADKVEEEVDKVEEEVDKVEEEVDKVEEEVDKVEEEVDKVEEAADEVEQELQSPVAPVVIPEVEEASEPVSTLEDFPKSDAVVLEDEKVTEHDILVPQAPVEDKATLTLAHDEEVFAPTEEVVSAISATLESTGNLQEENSKDISPKLMEEIAPVPSIEATASNDEELLDAESGALLEIVEAKPEEPQEVVEETNAMVPVVEVIVEAEDGTVHVVDQNAEGGGIIDEVEGRVAEGEDKASGQAEARVEVLAEVAEVNVGAGGERAEEVSAAGATSEDLVEETTLAVDENAAEFAHKTAVEPVEVSREKGEEPVAAIVEETVSAPSATQPVQASSEFVENVEDPAGIEEDVVIDRTLSEPALDLSSVEEATPEATEGVEEQLEEPVVAILQDENASPLTVPKSVEEVEGKVEGVVGVEDVMAKPEDEPPFDTARGVIEEKGGVPAVQAEEEVPAVASKVLLETSLEDSAALHEETSTSSFALEAEAGPVELFDRKEEDAIVEALAPEHTEMTSVDSIVPIEEKEIPVHIPEQEPEAKEVQKADEVAMILEERAPATSDPVEAVESVEVSEENAGERALVIEDEAEHHPAAISEVNLGASSEAVEESSGDGTQVVEEQTALNPEHTAEPPTEAVEEVVEATEPDVEEPAAHIETQEVVVISEFEPLAGAGEAVEAVEAVEEVVPSSEDAIVRQTAEEPITTLAETEVAPIPASAYGNVEEKQVDGTDQAMQAEVVPGHLEAPMGQVVEIGQKEELVVEAQLEQHTATNQGVVEAVSLIETELASDPIVAPDAADDLIEQALDMATPTVEETIGSVVLGTEHVPASGIPLDPVLAIVENDEEEPNTATEEEFRAPESPLVAGETVGGFDYQVEEKTIVVDEAEVSNIC
jgi:hypothetical protein